VRSVKWLSHIQLAETEAEGPWQRGLNYKTLPPGVSDANTIDLDQMPSMTEMSLFSGITNIHLASTGNATPGDRVTVQAKGWALSGGGRNIVRVDVTGDEGKSWATAQLRDGSKQRFGRAWAWTFWECDIPAVVREDGTVRLASKAVDVAFNVQPESCQPSWNVRGLGNNSWYQANATVCTSSI
jgi:sulfite oxidase